MSRAAAVEMQLAREGLAAHDMEIASYAAHESSSVHMDDEGEYDLFDQMAGEGDLSHLIEGLTFEQSLLVLDRLGIEYAHLLDQPEPEVEEVAETVASHSFKSLFNR